MKTTSRRKRFTLGCAALLVLVLVLVIWWSRNAIVFVAPEGAFPGLTARQLEDPSGTALVVELELSGETSGFKITDLNLRRDLAKTLGLTAPEGFEEELLPLEGSELNDPELVRFVDEWNAENIRWRGELEIVPATPIVLRIPASAPLVATGPLVINYGRSTGFGGHSSSARLVLNEARRGEP